MHSWNSWTHRWWTTDGDARECALRVARPARPSWRMPRVVCEVTSVKKEHHEGDTEGGYPSYDEVEVRAEIADENVRTWGRQLYALVGVFYIPVVVDALWFRGKPDVQDAVEAAERLKVGSCEASREADCEAAVGSLTGNEGSDTQGVSTPDWSGENETVPPRYGILSTKTSEVHEVFKEQTSEVCVALLALQKKDAFALVARLKAYGKARVALKDGSVVEILPNMVELAVEKMETVAKVEKEKLTVGELLTLIIFVPLAGATYVVGYPIMLVLVHLLNLIVIMIGSAFTLAHNVIFALTPLALLRERCKYFNNGIVSIRKSINDDGKEVWELLTTLTYYDNQINYLPCADDKGPSIPIDALRPGDKIKVGFGPFEHWCLFLN